MGEPAEWMKPSTDDAILETLQKKGNQQPVHVATQIDRHRKYVGERLRELAKYGLVENLGQGLYRISDAGVQYLEGELDTSEIEPKDE